MEKVFETKDGVKVTAVNEVQAAAFKNEGLKEVDQDEEPKRRSK